MLNFGLIKEHLNNILILSFNKNKSVKRDIFKKYINEVKNNPILKEQFLVYRNLETNVLENKDYINDFINENIKILSNFGVDKITTENKKLIEKLNIKINENIEYNKKDLHENIVNLIKYSNSAKNINIVIESKNFIKESVLENKVKETISENLVPNSVLAKVSLDKFKEKYQNLTEEENRIIKAIVEDDESKKEAILKEYSSKCINLIDESFEDSSIELKNKLLKVKNKILNTTYQNESFVNDITNILSLTNKINKN